MNSYTNNDTNEQRAVTVRPALCLYPGVFFIFALLYLRSPFGTIPYLCYQTIIEFRLVANQ